MFFDWFYENNLKIENCVGIDEVGRGPLAGPVVSAAVWISRKAAEDLEKLQDKMPVRDSKKLSHSQRQNVIKWLENQSLDDVLYGIGETSVAEIDSINIRNAAFLSMKRAFQKLCEEKRKREESKGTKKEENKENTELIRAEHEKAASLTKVSAAPAIEEGFQTILVDGNAVPNLSINEENGSKNNGSSCEYPKNPEDIRAIIKGDAKVLNISLASIIAKEFRDNIMRELAAKYPQYGWNTNVGYGTKDHLSAIKSHGITEHHRKSFAPIKAQIP